MNSTSFSEYLARSSSIAQLAGERIMTHFSPDIAVQQKADNTPVTQADLEAHEIIVAALSALTPEIPIVSEEDAVLNLGGHARFWLVDPLDGTRAFVRGEPEFTVNIALVDNGFPVLGVIYHPPQDALYLGCVGVGAYRGGERIQVRKPAADGLVVVRSKSHPSARTQAYLDKLKIKELIPGSSSVKFCRVAEGSADLYPRFGRTMEWDTAAGQAILEAAGGRVETTDGNRLSYGKPGFENPAFIGFGG